MFFLRLANGRKLGYRLRYCLVLGCNLHWLAVEI